MKQLKKFDCSTAHEGIEVYCTIPSMEIFEWFYFQKF